MPQYLNSSTLVSKYSCLTKFAKYSSCTSVGSLRMLGSNPLNKPVTCITRKRPVGAKYLPNPNIPEPYVSFGSQLSVLFGLTISINTMPRNNSGCSFSNMRVLNP